VLRGVEGKVDKGGYIMQRKNRLPRFIEVQEVYYDIAVKEIKNKKKTGHWMWYIFPQVKGLGFSLISQKFSLYDLQEASQYLNHDILGKRLIEISQLLLELDTDDAMSIFGYTDEKKLRSSMTLFASVEGSPDVFQKVLDKFFQGQPDNKTLQLLQKQL
jgi:uncharacterized protein (DUF1810 family)